MGLAMRLRKILCITAIGAGITSCSPQSGGPAVTPTDARAEPAGPSASPSAAVAVTPAPEGTTGGAATASAAPERAAAPTAETLAKLPPGAAVYVAVRAGELGAAVAAVPGSQVLLREVSRELGGKEGPDAILAAAGVDLRRPILGAVVPASEKNARAVIDAVAGGASGKAEEKVVRQHAAEATRVRILVPLAKGADAGRAAAALVKTIAGGTAMDACPGARACAGFGAEAPIGVAQGERAAVAAYADGADLRLDVAMPLFVPGADPAAVEALVAFRGSRGGFEGRCSRFDAGASASACVDAARAGDLGATTGYAMTVDALSGGSIEARMRREIAAVGRAEAQQNLALAAPARRLAGDGTLSLTVQGARSRILATWALTDASRPAVEKAFAAERCAAGRAVSEQLVPALREAFGDPGKGFSDPKKAIVAFKEAGWGAFPVAFAGTWPNLLGVLSSALGKVAVVPGPLQVCARHEDGRLVMVIQERP